MSGCVKVIKHFINFLFKKSPKQFYIHFVFIFFMSLNWQEEAKLTALYDGANFEALRYLCGLHLTWIPGKKLESQNQDLAFAHALLFSEL